MAVCSGINVSHDNRSFSADVIAECSQEWGPILELWEGHAGDCEVRFKGGSGGVATALGLYCVEQDGMHGVLHAHMDSESPHLSCAAFSRTREELVVGTGSRYAPVAVCGHLRAIESAPGPCALIGKPCDIVSAHKAGALRPSLARNLGLTVSVFCGGTPAIRGTFELLKELGARPSQIRSLRYRGWGWPGMTGVDLKTKKGNRLEMTYHKAWDTILTKHKPLRCLICPDGTGEFADIACGDPWYRPVRKGEHGSTLVIVRTHRGREILRRAMQAGYIVAERRTAAVLARSQHGLLNRRRHVWPKLSMLHLLGIPAPRFRGFSLWRSWRRLRAKRMFVSLYRALRMSVSLRRRGPARFSATQIEKSLRIRALGPPAKSGSREAVANQTVSR